MTPSNDKAILNMSNAIFNQAASELYQAALRRAENAYENCAKIAEDHAGLGGNVIAAAIRTAHAQKHKPRPRREP